MTRWLYLSPHLDDAVLSAGATISARVRAGDEVCVATAFTGTGAAPSDLARRRREEDLRAAALLGFEALHLGLPDAPFRDPAYCTYDAIVFGPEDRPCDLRARQTLSDMLALLLDARPFDHIVAPLGVGGHIDHRLTFAALDHLATTARVRYYEDRPYAFATDAVEVRWGALSGQPLTAGPPADKERGGPGFVLEHYMVDERDRRDSLEKMARARAGLPEGARGARAWRRGESIFEGRATPCSEIDRQALTEAIVCYSTQLNGLFGRRSHEAVSAVYDRFVADTPGRWSETEWIRV